MHKKRGEKSCTLQNLPNTSCLIPMLLLQALSEKPTSSQVKIIPVEPNHSDAHLNLWIGWNGRPQDPATFKPTETDPSAQWKGSGYASQPILTLTRRENSYSRREWIHYSSVTRLVTLGMLECTNMPKILAPHGGVHEASTILGATVSCRPELVQPLTMLS